MKIKQLHENESLELIEITKHLKNPFFDLAEIEIIEQKQIQMKTFTDGQIISEDKETIQNIEEYYIGNEKYQYAVDTLKIRNIQVTNHSYVIVYLIAKEVHKLGNIKGWFDVVKDVSIYLKNPKDKEALKNAKKVIQEIENRNKSVSHHSLFKMLCSQGNYKIENVSKNVYTFTKQNNIKI